MPVTSGMKNFADSRYKKFLQCIGWYWRSGKFKVAACNKSIIGLSIEYVYFLLQSSPLYLFNWIAHNTHSWEESNLALSNWLHNFWYIVREGGATWARGYHEPPVVSLSQDTAGQNKKYLIVRKHYAVVSSEFSERCGKRHRHGGLRCLRWLMVPLYWGYHEPANFQNAILTEHSWLECCHCWPA